MFTPIIWTELTGIDTTKLNDIENALYFLDNGYSKTTWTGLTGINNTRLQKIEDAIEAFDATYSKTTWADTRITTGKLQNINDGLCVALSKKPTIATATTGGSAITDEDGYTYMEGDGGTATLTFQYEIPLNTFNRMKIRFLSDYVGSQSLADFKIGITGDTDAIFTGFANKTSGLVLNTSGLTGNNLIFTASGEISGCDDGRTNAYIYGVEFYNV